MAEDQDLILLSTSRNLGATAGPKTKTALQKLDETSPHKAWHAEIHPPDSYVRGLTLYATFFANF